MDQELAEKVFNEADKDGDGLITYVEYFTFIERYVCQTKAGKIFIDMENSVTIKNHPKKSQKNRK